MELSGENKKLSSLKNRDEILPQELIIEILSWLPIKHLSPLRFVSKSWFQLLTKDPQFAKLQFDRFMQSNPNPSIIVSKQLNDSNLLLATDFESCDKALTLQLPIFNQAANYYIGICLSGICNGLLCFYHVKDLNQVYIWNPLINDHITISCLPAPSRRFPVYHISTEFGFGFDQDSNVYKVVRFFSEVGTADISLTKKFETWTQISVYTIGVDSMWRTVLVDLPCYLTLSTGFFPLVNGVLHCEASGLHNGSRDLIYTFDLKREVIGELLPPCGIKFNEIMELGGLLCVIDQNDVSEMHIWVMKEYGIVSSWSKQYVIKKPHNYNLFPLGFTHNKEILMQTYGCNLALYSPETNTVRDLNRFLDKIHLPYAYIESIISPTAVNRAGHNLLEEES